VTDDRVNPHYSPARVIFESNAPGACEIRFDGEWLPVAPGSLVIEGEVFSCISGERLVIGATSSLHALGFEAVTK
jgi:hypothetical protein